MLFLAFEYGLREIKGSSKEGEKYERPNELEAMFNELASYYDGARRDAVLYSVLTNYIQGGKNIERVEPLLKAYKEKYCTDKHHADILDALMQ